ncbi:tRNA lysidine(34) synthetase TilS [Roseofilum reptotaenium CS-1145]|uniref:tRNA(Ile)-lysidine synthase n=1 Tax=Roseofilum reptotaenium AO1-A TaxID=1925591 RepID=A0A1L9QVP9_9CYAN|nr:tRNA lysidine(34) synthetase TilS [Roseofilum reptotaenium]MDB9520242.1 tRNA lysidine(34) synthetase TilS [Roseofilum reptotaenium CS-1145]OJJ26716.1 tRNA lysidine(34) synthetase TilS [Roseofilum reptotaenium AO1-A]
MAGSSKPDWSDLHAKFQSTLRSRPQLLPPQESLLVAVSGGQDSVCLLKLLLDLQPNWRWHLAVAHCDHQMRPDSATNAQHVSEVTGHWNLSFYQKTAEQPLQGEAAARSWRYHALIALAETHGFSRIVTGHTKSDRAETLLHNLIRGSGLDGLAALTWQRPLTENVQLVRPMLEIGRSQTTQFCQHFHLPIWEDSTNQETRYTRNQIRLHLIPALEAINPQVQTHLATTAELLDADVEYLESIAKTLYTQVSQPNLPQLNRQLLADAPLSLQRRVIRQFLIQWLPHAPNFAQVEKVTHLIAAPNRSQTDPFPGGRIACVHHPWIELKL